MNNRNLRFVAGLALGLVACSDDGTTARAPSPPVKAPADAPPDAPGHVNEIPLSPAAGESRAGQTYSIYIQVPATGDTFAFTVFEPATLEGGQKYPLVLYGHGGGESRVTDANDPATSNQPINNPLQYIEHGYGVISMPRQRLFL